MWNIVVELFWMLVGLAEIIGMGIGLLLLAGIIQSILELIFGKKK